jgi:enamine deaminase RidA (YjgF/YER057c/UK114 family)
VKVSLRVAWFVIVWLELTNVEAEELAIERQHLISEPGPVMSKCVIHGNMVYTAGITASDLLGDVSAQMREVLDTVDGLLADAGTDKFKILTAQVWLSDMALFQDMNAVWNAWVDSENPPSRACVSGDLYCPEALVEVVVTAVVKD